ncbi:MAG: hypothetical protein ACKPCM_09255 [Pseudanabaena sp.]
MSRSNVPSQRLLINLELSISSIRKSAALDLLGTTHMDVNAMHPI